MSIITWGEGQGGVGAFDVKAGDIRASAETPLPASAVSWFPFISSWTLRGRNLGSVSRGSLVGAVFILGRPIHP